MPKGIYKHKINQGFQKRYTPWNKNKKLTDYPQMGFKKGNKINLGKKNAWKGGLENRKKDGDRRSSAYISWRQEVWKQDNFRCKINNKNCKGKIMAHHILSWRDFPELRYKINNGITLCQFHHPRKRVEEQKLIPTFQSLVEVR